MLFRSSRFAILWPADSPDPGLGTATELARLRRLVAKWRPATRLCVGFFVCTSGRFVGWPERLVDDGGTVGSSDVNFYAAE